MLDTLYIEIEPDDLAQIEAKREEALRLGILLASGGDYVPATIRLGHDEIAVELRLKGDWTDHFAYDKWSFRVRVLGENALYGMRVFSLQDPSTRAYLNEWLFLENLRREGVLGVGYRFVRVVLNGEAMGIYALEEGFARELFEAQGRREGLIIRYDEDLVWEYRAFYEDQLIPRGVNAFHIVDDFQSGRIDADPALSAQRDVAIGLLRGLWTGERAAADVLDLETMGTFLALSDLWNAHHGLIWHNLRYYYNPITARLEPVAFDTHPLIPDLDPEMVGLPWYVFCRDPHLQAAYVRALARISQPGYVESLEAEWGPAFDALRAALEPEFGPNVLAPPWDMLRRRQTLIRQVLAPYQMVYAYVVSPQPGPTSTVQLEIGNLLELPVEVVGLEVDGRTVPARHDWVAPDWAGLVVPAPADDPESLVLRALARDTTYMPYTRLEIPRAAFASTGTLDLPELGVVTRLWSLTDTLTQTVLAAYPLPLGGGPRPDQPTVEEALLQHPYLQPADDEGMLRIASGTWEIAGDLILPAGFGLHLEPGTTLRFGRDSLLFSTGPLDFQGTTDAPIVLGPSDDTWNGIVVLEADGPSAWDYVTVERTSALDRDGWALTGGITFYESPIRLEHCRILDSLAEDSINVVRTVFAFVASEFGRSASDAFDADFAHGSVEECSFHDTGGDGIDVSGSQVQVLRVRFLNIGDKGISVGEASRLTAEEVTFEAVGFGLVSKDLSHATLVGATILDARVAGLAAYIKKPAYGPASIEASGVTFLQMPPERHTLVQTGSWIDLEGERIWGTDVDVDALYGDGGP